MKDKLFWLFMLGLLFGSMLFYSCIAHGTDYRYNGNNEYSKESATFPDRSAQTKD